MAQLCQNQIQSTFDGVQVEIIGYKERPQQAVGNGSGIK